MDASGTSITNNSGTSGGSGTNNTPGSVTLSFSSVLPVELVKFEARLSKSTVNLDWQTTSEHNNDGFDIQRTVDGGKWHDLAFLPGHGTSLEEHSYTYTDERPLPGMNYYRLQQMDFDGSFEYSPTVSVEMEWEGGGISIFPNPASGTVTLALETDYTGEAIFTLYNLFGSQMKTQSLTLEGSPLRTEVDLTGLPDGVYLATATVGNEQWQKRLVVE